MDEKKRKVERASTVCLCHSPSPASEDSVMGYRWKGNFEEGVILPLLPRRRKKGIRAGAPDTARDVKIHTLTAFHIMHLTSVRSTFEGDLTVHFILIWAKFCETDHMGDFVNTSSVLTAMNCTQKSSLLAGQQLSQKSFAKAAQLFTSWWSLSSWDSSLTQEERLRGDDRGDYLTHQATQSYCEHHVNNFWNLPSICNAVIIKNRLVEHPWSSRMACSILSGQSHTLEWHHDQTVDAWD